MLTPIPESIILFCVFVCWYYGVEKWWKPLLDYLLYAVALSVLVGIVVMFLFNDQDLSDSILIVFFTAGGFYAAYNAYQNYISLRKQLKENSMK